MLSAYISINGSVGCTKQWSRTAGQEHARQPMNQSSQKAASFGYFFEYFKGNQKKRVEKLMLFMLVVIPILAAATRYMTASMA
jgi:hypothetical protein